MRISIILVVILAFQGSWALSSEVCPEAILFSELTPEIRELANLIITLNQIELRGGSDILNKRLKQDVDLKSERLKERLGAEEFDRQMALATQIDAKVRNSAKLEELTSRAKEAAELRQQIGPLNKVLTFGPEKVPHIVPHPFRNLVLVSNSESARADVWDLDSRKVIQSFPACKGSSEIAFTPDGNFALTHTDLWHIAVWDLKDNRKPVSTYKASGALGKMSISSDGSLLAAINGGQITLWDLNSHKQIKEIPPPNNSEIYDDIMFVPGTQLLLVDRSQSDAQLFDPFSETDLLTLNSGGSRPGRSHVLGVSAHGKYAFTSSKGETIKIWDLELKEEILEYKPPAHAVKNIYSTAADNNLVILDEGGGVILWDILQPPNQDYLVNPGSGFSSGGIIMPRFGQLISNRWGVGLDLYESNSK